MASRRQRKKRQRRAREAAAREAAAREAAAREAPAAAEPREPAPPPPIPCAVCHQGELSPEKPGCSICGASAVLPSGARWPAGLLWHLGGSVAAAHGDRFQLSCAHDVVVHVRQKPDTQLLTPELPPQPGQRAELLGSPTEVFAEDGEYREAPSRQEVVEARLLAVGEQSRSLIQTEIGKLLPRAPAREPAAAVEAPAAAPGPIRIVPTLKRGKVLVVGSVPMAMAGIVLGLGSNAWPGTRGQVAFDLLTWLVGSITGYVALVLALNHVSLRLRKGRLELRQGPLPFGSRVSIDAGAIDHFEMAWEFESPSKNVADKTFALHAQLRSGERRFVTRCLTMEQLQAVQRELEQQLGFPPQPDDSFSSGDRPLFTLSGPRLRTRVIWAVVSGLIAAPLLTWQGIDLHNLWRARHCTSWPSVPGTVISSRIERGVLTGSDGWSEADPRETWRCYIPKVRYRFSLNGMRREADRVRFHPTLRGGMWMLIHSADHADAYEGEPCFCSRKRARAVIGGYAPGIPVQVHHAAGGELTCLEDYVGVDSLPWAFFRLQASSMLFLGLVLLCLRGWRATIGLDGRRGPGWTPPSGAHL